jgi:hypothetical protein
LSSEAIQPLSDVPFLSFHDVRIVQSFTHAILIVFRRPRGFASRSVQLEDLPRRRRHVAGHADAAVPLDGAVRRRLGAGVAMQVAQVLLQVLPKALKHGRPSGICG